MPSVGGILEALGELPQTSTAQYTTRQTPSDAALLHYPFLIQLLTVLEIREKGKKKTPQ